MDTPNTPRNKTTVEVYRDLLQVEVKSLIGRVAELTDTVGNLFVEVNGIALQMEHAVDRLEQMKSGLEYCREEIRAINTTIAGHEKTLSDIQKRVKTVEEQLDRLNGKGALTRRK